MVSRFREAHRTDGVKCRLQRARSSQGGRAHRRPEEAERWLRQEGLPEARAGDRSIGGIVASWAQS